MTYNPIENYGIIGDEFTTALVGLDGSIDFFCFPNFDSPSVFAKVLDDQKGGFFRIAPLFNHSRHNQLYVPDTNVLLTRFMSHEGILEITDFMPRETDPEIPSKIVRIVKSIRGTVKVSMVCDPSFDYGQETHTVEQEPGGNTIFMCSQGKYRQSFYLQATHPLCIKDNKVFCEFDLPAGEYMSFVLTCGDTPMKNFSQKAIEDLQNNTIRYWREWVKQSQYSGRWQEIVNRSALALKLLTSRKYGSIIAAPTFGLPEAIGGQRNWDYRYCWIRDSAFTVHALLRMGFKDEAVDFMKWVEALYTDATDEHGTLQVMYRMDGSTDLSEYNLDNFDGYQQSRPVRVGNAAADQFQLDIYGELMDSIYQANKHVNKVSYDAWQNVVRTTNFLCNNWQKPDAGIWEFRGTRREFLHSRVMCWVAVDRAIKLAQEESLPAPFREWIQVRGDIYEDIFTNFWNEKLGAFVQHKGGNFVDASALLMPMVQIISPQDPKWLSTLKVIDEQLAIDSLVYRYRGDLLDVPDIDASVEGSFNACSFWYIECLARSGYVERAQLLFDKMIGYANHLGLFAEEIADDGRQLGNFPQAFTHLALISAAFALERPLVKS